MLSRLRDRVGELVRPLAEAIAKTGISPNLITLVGLAVGLLAAILFSRGEQFWAGVALLLAGFFDVIDGAVARALGRETAFGGVLDSVIDRYVDFLILSGIICAFLSLRIGEAGLIPGWGWGILAIAGSFMVSYIRARAEAAGAGRLDVGVAERAERLIILAIGALVGYTQYSVVIIAVLTHLTVLQRLFFARLRLR